MELTFLGTGSMVPTKERNVTALFLSYKNTGILVDCGEGTQRQMNIAGINRNKVDYILISHWHGDHVSGLIGLIQTLGNQTSQNEEGVGKKIHIYGPKGTEEHFEHLLNTCIFENKLVMDVHEIVPKKGEALTILDKEDFIVQAVSMDHSVPCIGYAFVEKDIRRIDMNKVSHAGLKSGPLVGKLQSGETIVHEGKEINPQDVSHVQKGRRIAFVFDTAPCSGVQLLAEDADLFICEATYASALEEKAEGFKHMSAKSAALLATHANVKRLILTHLSQRYKTPQEVLDDAKDIFANVEVAYDFMKVKL